MSRQRNLILLLVLIMLFNLTLIGCGQKSSPSQKPQTDTAGQKPKAPKSAEAILTDINNIIGELAKQNKTAHAPWMAGTSSVSPDRQTGGQGAGSNSGQSGASSQAGKQGSGPGSGNGPDQRPGAASGGSTASGAGAGGSQSLASGEPIRLQWQKIGMSLMNIHKKWNELEPDVIDAGLPPSSLTGFEEALSQLTQSVSSQKTGESLQAAIDLYDQYTTGISQVFTLSTPPELYQVQYRTMAALAAADRQDWTAASDSITAALEPWGLLKAQAKKAGQKLLDRCDYSLQDLKAAITVKDSNMVMIKGEIARANLKQLEKALAKGNQEQ